MNKNDLSIISVVTGFLLILLSVPYLIGRLVAYFFQTGNGDVGVMIILLMIGIAAFFIGASSYDPVDNDT